MMELFGKNTDKDVLVVAEIGMNHGGSLPWIKQFLVQLKDTGIDAVKFQLFTPEFFVAFNNEERFSQVSKVRLSERDFLEINTFCRNLKIPVFATPVSHDWVDFIDVNCGVIKVASGDFTFDPISLRAIETKSKVILSTGATSREEILHFISKAKAIRGERDLKNTVALMHCISNYPPKIEHGNLMAIQDIQKITGLTVGFSSHFTSDEPIYAALGLGARIFEIHVTDDRGRQDSRDHALSRTPEQIREITSNLRSLNLSMRDSEKIVQKSELDIQDQIRKGFIYSEKFEAGHLLKMEDITYARPRNPEFSNLSQIIGKSLGVSVGKYEAVSLKHFQK